MKIVDDRVLQEARERRRCEWCKRAAIGYLHPHHLWTRGHGGGGQLDIRVNIIGLCWECHGDAHHTRITRGQLLSVVATRENTNTDTIEELIAFFRRVIRPTPIQLERELRSLNKPAELLARSILHGAAV